MASPKQKPGRSYQEYQTPENFIAAVKSRFGIESFAVDLAASDFNTQALKYYAVGSLSEDWDSGGGYAWLNPPYGNIEPWVQKAYESRENCTILVLVPMSSANWARDWVFGKAEVLFLNGRITFVGCAGPYPKDLMLLHYSNRVPPCCDVWDWE